jgi:hypothetical protein
MLWFKNPPVTVTRRQRLIAGGITGTITVLSYFESNKFANRIIGEDDFYP